jgi:hypothetical protein
MTVPSQLQARPHGLSGELDVSGALRPRVDRSPARAGRCYRVVVVGFGRTTNVSPIGTRCSGWYSYSTIPAAFYSLPLAAVGSCDSPSMYSLSTRSGAPLAGPSLLALR